MPTNSDAQTYIHGLNARFSTAEIQGAESEHRDNITAARDYYAGNHRKQLKRREGEPDPNIVVNLCRAIVNKSVAWLFGDPERGQSVAVRIESDVPDVGPEDNGNDGEQSDAEEESAESVAEAYYENAVNAAGGARLYLKMGRRASVAGHGFVKIVPPGDPDNPGEFPRVIPLRAESVGVMTYETDEDTVESYVIQWEETRNIDGRATRVPVRQFVARPERSGGWIVAQMSESRQSGAVSWEFDTEPAAWPFASAPVVDWQNQTNDDGYYGLSDLEDLAAINDAINFLVSNVNRILYIHGHPRTVGTGFDAAELQDTAVDSFWTIPNPNAKIQNLEMRADMAAAFSFLQFLTQTFWNIGRDLDVTSLADRIGQVTNYGLRVLANGAISKLGEKRINYGDAIERIATAILEQGGIPLAGFRVVVSWRDPLPADDKEQVERLTLEHDLGIVSRETAATERGRDWESESRKIENEKTADGNVGESLLSAFERGDTFGGAGDMPPLPRTRGGAAPAEFLTIGGDSGNE